MSKEPTTLGVEQEGDFKMKKKKPRKLTSKKNETVKLDLTSKETKKEEDAVPKSEPVLLDENKQTGNVQEMDARTSTPEVPPVKKEKVEEESGSPIEEIKIGEQEKEVEPQVASTPKAEVHSHKTLPENIEKLTKFMNDTGGTIEDYVRLNADYSGVSDEALLKEYYKKNKPYLTADEIELQLEDKFSYDESYDEEKEIRRKKLAIKEEVAKAKGFLDNLKSEYYEEIKLRPGTTQDQQKAMDFFNRYNKEQEIAKQQHEDFKSTTKQMFTNEFKGFEFNVGEKKFRYGINNPNEVADAQSNISNWVKTFLDEDGSVKDHRSYHKAMYAARNADTIAKHFYEQGKADAIKNINAKSKNIGGEARQSAPSDVFINGLKVKAVNGVDSSKLKIKKRKL